MATLNGDADTIPFLLDGTIEYGINSRLLTGLDRIGVGAGESANGCGGSNVDAATTAEPGN